MIVSVEVPDVLANQLQLEGTEGGRRALEMLALEGYRSGQLSRGQVTEMLGSSLWETETLLKKHGCGLGVSLEEYERDLATARELVKK